MMRWKEDPSRLTFSEPHKLTGDVLPGRTLLECAAAGMALADGPRINFSDEIADVRWMRVGRILPRLGSALEKSCTRVREFEYLCLSSALICAIACTKTSPATSPGSGGGAGASLDAPVPGSGSDSSNGIPVDSGPVPGGAGGDDIGSGGRAAGGGADGAGGVTSLGSSDAASEGADGADGMGGSGSGADGGCDGPVLSRDLAEVADDTAKGADLSDGRPEDGALAADAAGPADVPVAGGVADAPGALDAAMPSGQLYVINAGSNHDNAILRFASPGTVDGNVAPAARITGPASTLRCAHFGYLDVGHDRMYVADPCPPAGVDVFDNISTLNGAVAPSRRISGSNTTFAIGELVGNDTMLTVALDSARDLLYVSSAKQDGSVAEVAVFANAQTATGNIAPTHVITTPAVPGRALNFNHGVTIDSDNDRLYVASIADNSILVFDSASTVDGETIPTRWLSGSATGLGAQAPLFTKLDPEGNLIVNCRTQGIPPSAGAIKVFAAANFRPSVTGNINAAPLRAIVGAATTLLGPHMSDYCADTDELFVGNAWTGDVLVFSAFSIATGNLAPSRTLTGPATGLDIAAGSNVPRTATGVMLDLTR